MSLSRKSALNKLMDYLARRPHSESELTEKLLRDFIETDVQDAIEHAKEKGWIKPPSDLSEELSSELGRKRKGVDFINQVLAAKGLPPVTEDPDAEISKARAVLEQKLSSGFDENGVLAEELVPKAQRLLANRGFTEETIRRVLARD